MQNDGDSRGRGTGKLKQMMRVFRGKDMVRDTKAMSVTEEMAG